MAILSFEGIVEDGRIRLPDDVALPDKARVYVVIPDYSVPVKAHVSTPRLAHPEQAAKFIKKIVEVDSDAEL